MEFAVGVAAGFAAVAVAATGADVASGAVVGAATVVATGVVVSAGFAAVAVAATGADVAAGAVVVVATVVATGAVIAGWVAVGGVGVALPPQLVARTSIPPLISIIHLDISNLSPPKPAIRNLRLTKRNALKARSLIVVLPSMRFSVFCFA
jgi:hypothetical protein